jgi:hypothetical protein
MYSDFLVETALGDQTSEWDEAEKVSLGQLAVEGANALNDSVVRYPCPCLITSY